MSFLKDVTVLDFSQFLAGPSCSLRLADLGARVIKVERPGVGDQSKKLCLNDQKIGEDSLLFYTINRNKESIALNLKDDNEKKIVLNLVKQADVLIENNRPGVMKKLGLDYETLKKINPALIYATVTGYGPAKSLLSKPGHDLLAQSMSGITFLNGNEDQPPTPFALSIADSFAGIHMTEGILAALVRRTKTKQGTHIEVSLLESAIAIQFEVLTAYFNDGHRLPKRAKINNAHVSLAAPYGLYKTKDGYLSLAMGSLDVLSKLLELPILKTYMDGNRAFVERDDIYQIISKKMEEKTTEEWLQILQAAGYWCGPVFNWEQLRKEDGYRALEMEVQLKTPARDYTTTGCPIRINGKRPNSAKPALILNQHREMILDQYGKEGCNE